MSKARGWTVFILVLICTIGWGFGGSIRAPWLFDDHDVAERLGEFVDGANAREFWTRLAMTPRPLRQLTLWMDAQLGGKGPAWPRTANLAWHAAAAGLWAALLLRLGFGRRVAWAAALLFAVLPVHWETFGIVSHRKEQLALVFTLAGLLGLGAHGRTGRIAGLACFALAVLGKEAALVFPVLAWLLYARRGTQDGAPGYRWLSATVAWAILLAVLASAHVHWSVAQLAPDDVYNPRPGTPLAAAFATAIRSFPRYARLMLDPSVGPCLDRSLDIPANRAWAAADLVLSSVFCAAWVLAWWTAQRRGSRRAIPLGWVPVALAPVIWPWFLASGRVALLSGRYAYFATPGMALLVVLALERLPGKSPLPALLLLVAILSTTSHLRADDFASERALWEATLRENPASPMACNNMAFLAHREGGPREGLRVLTGLIRRAGRNPFRSSTEPPGHRVAVAGDSVPYGYNEENPSLTLSLAARMERRASRDYPTESWTFDSWAVSGSTLAELAPRLEQRLKDNPTDYCVIMAGHNDAVFGAPPDVIADFAASAMITCLLHGTVPLWVAPAPVHGIQYPMRARQAATLADFSRIVDDLCDETGIVHLPSTLPSPHVAGMPPPEEAPDTRNGVHLDYAEMENLAGIVFFKGLRPLAIKQ